MASCWLTLALILGATLLSNADVADRAPPVRPAPNPPPSEEPPIEKPPVSEPPPSAGVVSGFVGRIFAGGGPLTISRAFFATVADAALARCATSFAACDAFPTILRPVSVLARPTAAAPAAAAPAAPIATFVPVLIDFALVPPRVLVPDLPAAREAGLRLDDDALLADFFAMCVLPLQTRILIVN
jgi:hypothetical protein